MSIFNYLLAVNVPPATVVVIRGITFTSISCEYFRELFCRRDKKNILCTNKINILLAIKRQSIVMMNKCNYYNESTKTSVIRSFCVVLSV